MARVITEQSTEKGIPEQDVKNKHILTFEITDPEWGETYTAYLTKECDRWSG